MKIIKERSTNYKFIIFFVAFIVMLLLNSTEYNNTYASCGNDDLVCELTTDECVGSGRFICATVTIWCGLGDETTTICQYPILALL